MSVDRDQPPRRRARQERSIATEQRLLDAAVAGLIDEGYEKLTTASISQRAKVSRGAQQHHFPLKETLVATAVMQIHDRHVAEIRSKATHLGPAGHDRVERVLDLLWESYSSNLFTATLALAISAEKDPSLAVVVADGQRRQRASLVELCGEVFPPDITGAPEFHEWLAMVLATIRGLALLHYMQTPPESIARHWAFARANLTTILTAHNHPESVSS